MTTETQNNETLMVSIDYEKLYQIKSDVLKEVVETGKNYIDALLKDIMSNNPGLKISESVNKELDAYVDAYQNMVEFDHMVELSKAQVESQDAMKH